MRTFSLYRTYDNNGISGTGEVLNGVVFHDGLTVVRWTKMPHAVGIYRHYQEFYDVHVKRHPENYGSIKWHGDSIDSILMEQTREGDL